MLNRGASGSSRGVAAACPAPQVCKRFCGGCSWERLQVQVHGVPSCRPRGSLGWGCGAACVAGDGGSAQHRCSSGGRRRGESGKPRGAELSTQTTMQHPCTSLQRAGAPLGCSWEASPPPAERGRKHHLLPSQEACGFLLVLFEKCHSLSPLVR